MEHADNQRSPLCYWGRYCFSCLPIPRACFLGSAGVYGHLLVCTCCSSFIWHKYIVVDALTCCTICAAAVAYRGIYCTHVCSLSAMDTAQLIMMMSLSVSQLSGNACSNVPLDREGRQVRCVSWQHPCGGRGADMDVMPASSHPSKVAEPDNLQRNSKCIPVRSMLRAGFRQIDAYHFTLAIQTMMSTWDYY